MFTGKKSGKKDRQPVLESYQRGLRTIPELCRDSGENRDFVLYVLKENDLDYILTKEKHKPEFIGENSIKCRSCSETKEYKLFRKLKYGFSAECLDCINKKDRKRRYSTIEKLLLQRAAMLRSRGKARNLPVDVDGDYLIELFYRQEGKCFYTGDIMKWEARKIKLERDTLTVDKIIPEMGYVKGNVVLCTNKANHSKSFLTLDEMKKWMPKWYKMAMNHLAKSGF